MPTPTTTTTGATTGATAPRTDASHLTEQAGARSADRLPLHLTALGAVLAANGVLGVRWLFDGAERFSQTAVTWEFAAYQRVQLAAMVALVLLLPRFAALRGPASRRLSPAVLGVVTVATVLQACTNFAMGFVATFYAQVAPRVVDLEEGGSLAASMGAAWVLFALAVVALGVSALRSGALPRTTGVLLVLGALVTPMFGPIGGLLLGLGLLWAGLNGLRDRRTAPTLRG